MIRFRLLRSEWEYDPDSPLGHPGGFGAVFCGRNAEHEQVAIKRLHLDANQAAHRELRIADELVQRSLAHVVPILDYGLDAQSDKYFIVMARAEKSLEDEINRVGVFTDLEAVHVLQEIVAGLSEVSDIVHRDLKPGNVLYHEGRWKLADFGIARFVEESTSLQTLKDWWSCEYAAPEQWRNEHATSATDVYALGCIAYALLTGAPPFQGPTVEDYQQQHLHEVPPPLNQMHDGRLRSVVNSMLSKPPSSRPSRENVLAILAKIGKNAALHLEGFKALAEVSAVISDTELHKQAQSARQEADLLKRNDLYQECIRLLTQMAQDLIDSIADAAPTVAHTLNEPDAWGVQLGGAHLIIRLLDFHGPIAKGMFPISRWDVIGGSAIYVSQKQPQEYARSANLWYASRDGDEGYRWWEVSYAANAQYGAATRFEPHALNIGELHLADQAIAGHRPCPEILAAVPRPVDFEDFEKFVNHWGKLLAEASRGNLHPPNSYPITTY